MFSEGKTPVEVVIALDLPPDEVREMYRHFLELKNMHKLVEIYDEMENYLPSLLELFRIIESRGINKNDIINVLKIINTGQLPYLQSEIVVQAPWSVLVSLLRNSFAIRFYVCSLFPYIFDGKPSITCQVSIIFPF